MTSGTRAASASSAARVTFSPTTAPIEPPMNPKSMTQMATGVPPMVPVPHTAASRMPVDGLGRRQAVGVGLLVDEAERVDRLEAGVVLDPASRGRAAARAGWRRDSRKWWPQVGQTRIALSSCLLKSIASHDGHWVQRSGG